MITHERDSRGREGEKQAPLTKPRFLTARELAVIDKLALGRPPDDAEVSADPSPADELAASDDT